ncbi:MAG: delta-class carbonic anhydrase [Pseudoalteromonas sp.]|uniref:delta-class carbonic anhydrase n=1 Tax=unclassified Pseudoalteromonas TaxID=194690 RepID=UPI00191C8A79|nr:MULTISPECIES: delta-class carbonic anhydrase [unclassified Pseudoalteromonas]MDB2356094.1 delta-class carbonic anhydrase [Pseudoalteromonas sp.]MDP2634891.1 delta-class carbonic anhydrase [Pseudoalteromonas sp. 1_MG-2023]
MKQTMISKCVTIIGFGALALTSDVINAKAVSDSVIQAQRVALEKNTHTQGYGPQSPRDIDQAYGTNLRSFGTAPNRGNLNLCNIHFHKNAEHKGGEFTTFAGNGDGKGHNTGYIYDGQLSASQLQPVKGKVCSAKGSSLNVGDTLEVHFVYSSAQVKPGPTLGACLADSTMNPSLRVEGQVIVLANDKNAVNFSKLTHIEKVNGYYQAPNIPTNTGNPIEYLGSTTGPGYNEKASPLQVSWSVRPEVAVVNINSVGQWCNDNVFKEDHAHGVRNLVQNPKLLSPISK